MVPVVSALASPSNRSASPLPVVERASGFCVKTPVNPNVLRPLLVAKVDGRMSMNSPPNFRTCAPNDLERLSDQSQTPEDFRSGLFAQQLAWLPRAAKFDTLKMGLPLSTWESRLPGTISSRAVVAS